MQRIRVISPDGVRGHLPLNEWGNDAYNAGYRLENSREPIKVINPEGVSGTLPIGEWIDASQSGYTLNTHKEYNAGNRVASLAKSVAAGVGGSIPDAASLAYNLPAISANYLAKKGLPLGKAQEYRGENPNAEQLPLIPSATDAIESGIDNLTDGYTETPEDQKWLNEGVKYASSMAGGGAVAKGLQTMGKTGSSKVASMAGSTNPWHVGGAGVAGGVMSKSQDSGDGTLKTIGKGVAAQTAVNAIPSIPNIAKGGGNLLTKGGLALAGLGKNKLDLESAKAGRDLGINLPKAAVTESKVIALADQLLGKAPLTGDLMQSRYKKNIERTIDQINQIKDSTVSIKNLEKLDSTIKKLYAKRDSLLPESAQIQPKELLKEITNARNELNKSASLSDGEKKVMSVLQDYEKRFTPSGIKGVPAKVEDLIATKRSLNKIVNWKDPNINWKKEDKAQGALKAIHKALNEDLAEYGKTNSDWYRYHKQADKLHGQKETRKQLEDFFTDGVVKHSNDNFSFTKLSDKLNDPKRAKVLEKLVEPEVFEKINKLAKVSKAMATKVTNIPNPSSTAPTKAIIGFLTGGSAFAAPYATAAVVSTSVMMSHLLTDKKALDAAIRFAEKPTNKAAVAFNVRMKQLTGYTPVTLVKEAAKREEQEQDKQGTSMRQRIKLHLEENKKQPDGQAMRKLLGKPFIKETGKILNTDVWKKE